MVSLNVVRVLWAKFLRLRLFNDGLLRTLDKPDASVGCYDSEKLSAALQCHEIRPEGGALINGLDFANLLQVLQ